MNRRTFAGTLAGALVGTRSLGNNLDLFGEDSAPAAGMEAPSGDRFKLSVMLWTVFTDLPFEQRLAKVAEAGYRNVELVGEYHKWTDDDFERANAKRKELGITFDCTAGLKHGVSVPEHREILLDELRQTLPVMERIECPTMIMLSGNRVPGMAREIQHQCCVDTLKAAAKMVEGKSINGQPMRLLLETIDPEENPQYFLTEIVEALRVVEEVNNPQVQLLYDFYHQQISAGNLIAKLQKSISH